MFCQYKSYSASTSDILPSCSVEIICSLTVNFDIFFSVQPFCSADSIYPGQIAEICPVPAQQIFGSGQYSICLAVHGLSGLTTLVSHSFEKEVAAPQHLAISPGM